MKRIIVFIFALTAGIMFSFCSKNSTNNPTNTTLAKNYLLREFQNGAFPYTGYSGCTDTYFRSGNDTSNYGKSIFLKFGYSDWQIGILRSVIKFDVGSLPPDAKIIKAYLTLYFDSYSEWGKESFSIHKKTSRWVDSIITWANSSGGITFDTAPISTISIDDVYYYRTDFYKSFVLDPTMIQSWINDDRTNYGVLIKGNNEDTLCCMYCYSSEETTISYRPKLTVYYTVE